MTNKQLFNAIAQAYALNPAIASLPLTGLQQIALQEGCETEAYQDSLGNWSIGIGHLGSYAGETWTVSKCISQFFTDVQTIGVDPVNRNLSWALADMGTIRWWVFVNMAFNMGIFNLLQFNETLTAAEHLDWEGVAQGMENSLWYTQVGQRGVELCQQMRTNQWVLPAL